MKLMTLNLKAVGPFTDVVLDLSRGEQGLHLIYGPNEAGKTSTLRALSYLLFKFPHLSADDFVHPNDQLRVGGRLRLRNGQELEVIRRRGNQKTLRGPDDTTVIADDRLAEFLGSMDKETFEALFGIDHARLTKAGEEIRTGQGRLGELLFAAGAGLAGLSQAQKTLQQDLDELFKPNARAQNPKINKVLAEYRQAQEELKRCQLPSEEWQQHDRLLNETTSTADQIRGQIRAARGEQAGLKRIKSAIPLVARRRRLNQERDELGNVVRLRDDFGAEFRKEQDQLRLAEQTIIRSRDSLAEIDTQLAQLDPPQLLLDAAAEIESLQERLGAVEKASVDRGRLEHFQQDCEHQARRTLRELGRATDLDQAETTRLRVDEPTIIRRLGQRFAELRVQAEDARRTIARHDDQVKRQQKEQADLEPTRDMEPLRRAVKQTRKAGDLDAGLAEVRGKLARADKKAATALARVPGWNRSAEELQRLAVPLNATLDQYESQFQETARHRLSLTERMAAEDESIRQLETRLQTLDLLQDVPTEEALLATRQRREHGWRLVKAAWLDSAPDGEAVAAFLVEFASERTLASAYEQSVQRGDAIADRLRREADRVAHKAESLAQLNRHRTTREGLEREGQLVDERQARIDRDWNALVSPLGIEDQSRTPAELRAWLRQREEVVQLLEKVEEHRQSLEPLEQIFQKQRAAMSRALDAVDEPLSTTDSDLAEMLEKAEALIKRHDDLSQKRAKLETKLANAQAERATAELSLQSAEVELTGWRTEWSLMMARIGLEAEALPEQAEVFLTKITELLEKLSDRRGHQSRIRGIDRDADEFTRDVAALVARVAPDWADRSSADQARELARRLRAAQADAQKCTTLTQQRQREQGNLDAAETSRDEAGVCLERLCKEAGCADFDDLPEAERRSQNLARLEADRTACEEQLLVAAAGTDLLAFAAEAEQADPDSLDAKIEEFEVKIAAQEEELRRLDQTIGAERGELDRMDGSDRAAEMAEKSQTLLARLQRDVARYATLKLASAVMHRGIERYREKKQGPILARASALFAGMTGGSFARLQIDDDGEGDSHPVLKGVRPDGKLVTVGSMSDGSHDQLYLALRLASLESWLQSHEPIPFVVDDILLNFDDGRATAALGALVELSHRTQVLFFTHHRHIIDLANTHLPHKDVFVHELPGPRNRDSSTNSQVRLGEQAAK
jgi:uncharacterized protein YhaN